MIDLDPNTLSTLVRILRAHVGERSVSVVGSRAHGDAKPFADIDLLIHGQEPLGLRVRAALRYALDESDIPYKVDLIERCELSPEFRSRLEQHAERLF